MVIHTFGGDIKWHPHIHLLVTEGGLSLDGRQWIRPYNPGWLIQHNGLKRMWRYHCITAFRKAHKAGQLRFWKKHAYLKNYSCFNKVMSTIYKLTWYVHIGASLLNPEKTVRYTGRYTKRAVLAEYRITHHDGKIVRFAFKDYAQGGKTSYKTMPVLAFIGCLIRHTPDKHFKMVRYAGLSATRWKARYLAQAKAALGQEEEAAHSVSAPASLLPWRQRRIVEQGNDPLLCRVCQTPMRLVEKIFGSHAKIAGYFEAVGIPTAPSHPVWEPSPG